MFYLKCNIGNLKGILRASKVVQTFQTIKANEDRPFKDPKSNHIVL